MSHGIRRTGTWALLLVAAVAACSDSPTDPGGPGYTPVRIPQPNTDPLTLHDNVVVIDSVVLHMASSPAEITGGTYRFDVLGSPVPLIEVGDVIAGPEGLGFMGIATSVSYGMQVVVQTTQAYLVDVIKEGSLDISEPLDFSASAPAPGSALAPFYYLAPGVRPEARLTQFENVDLCKLAKEAKEAGLPVQACPEGISLTLPSGYVDLTADGRLKLKKRIGFILIDTFSVALSGGLVFDVTAKAVAKQDFNMGGEVVLRSLAVPLPLPAGASRVLKTKLLVSLKAGWGAGSEVEARVQSGAHMEAGVKIGGEWTFAKYDLTRGTPGHTGWSPIWDPTFSAEFKETSWAAQGSGFVRVYVRPDVQFIMQGIQGPRAGLEPNLKVTGTAGTESCQMRLTRSTDANVELFAHFMRLDWSSDTLKAEWPGAETDLIPPIPCPIGHLKVVTTTSGPSPDIDGYTVTLDGIDPMPITSIGSIMYSPLPPTSYSVELTGIADNCTVTSNPREINVTAGDTTLVSFPVVCTDPIPATGDIKVNTMTTGEDDGYSVVVDGDLGGAQPIGIDGTVTFPSLIAGNHTVELTDFGPNCVVSGNNPRTVALTNALVETDFEVTCGLTVTAATTGTDLDPDGYDVIVDGGDPINLADINGSLWFDIAPGMHSVELTGVADNCSVTGDNSRDVTAPAEETFEVDCEWGSAITFERAANVWQINPDGTGEQQLTTVAGATAESWSPDGTQTVFARYTSNCATSGNDCQAIFVSDADGTNAVQLTLPEAGVLHRLPDWSSDGARIVFDRIQESPTWTQSILTMDPDGADVDSVRVGDGTTNYAFPSWTPDGQIVYAVRVVTESTDDTYLAIMNADGSDARLLTTIGSARVYESDTSADNRIAFKRKLYQTQNTFDLMVVDADGSNLNNLSNGGFAVGKVAWSPNGSQIAFTLEGGPGVYLIDADGNNAAQLTDGSGSVAWRTLP